MKHKSSPAQPSMHRVVSAHLEDFKKRFALDLDQSRAFEAFVSYVILRSVTADAVSPADLIYEGDDPGIDSCMIFVDDAYVNSAEEVEEALSGKRRDCDAVIIFIQAKTSEAWNKKEINTFQSGVVEFLSGNSVYPQSDYLSNAAETFSALIKNVGKLRAGKPRVVCIFATTAQAPAEREILAAFKAFRNSLEALGLFSEVKVEPLHRDQLVDLWNAADGPVEATLSTIAMATFPKAPGVEEGYVATVRAADFVKNVLSDSHGKLRQRIFEENVRDYIGSDNEVNSEIVDCISDPARQKRFGILNNGVTLISSDVRVQGNELFLRDFQIVNGCQTSNVLFDQREGITPDETLMLKVVETVDATLIDEIVRSTNRQTKVQDDQFLATMDCVKAIEKYFIARGRDETYRLFFERRKNQFASSEVTALRVFGISDIARSVGSMFFDRPELASRYPNRLTGEMRNTVFKREYVEDITILPHTLSTAC